MEKLLTKKEVCEIFGIAARTLDRWISGKILPVQRFTKRTVRIKPSDVRKLLGEEGHA